MIQKLPDFTYVTYEDLCNKINEIIERDNLLVKVKLEKDAILPERKSEGAVGYDICSNEDVWISPGNCWPIKTGVYLGLPEGYECQIRPRSGLSLKKITVNNSPGSIDCDFRGELKVILINHSLENFHVEKGMRIAQLVFSRVLNTVLIKVKKLNKTKRGNKGFGSTGL